MSPEQVQEIGASLPRDHSLVKDMERGRGPTLTFLPRAIQQ